MPKAGQKRGVVSVVFSDQPVKLFQAARHYATIYLAVNNDSFNAPAARVQRFIRRVVPFTVSGNIIDKPSNS